MKPPNEGDPIWFTNNNDAPDPNPAPGIVTAVHAGAAIDCEITLSDNSTRIEANVNAPDPAVDYFRFWERRDDLEIEG